MPCWQSTLRRSSSDTALTEPVPSYDLMHVTTKKATNAEDTKDEHETYENMLLSGLMTAAHLDHLGRGGARVVARQELSTGALCYVYSNDSNENTLSSIV